MARKAWAGVGSGSVERGRGLGGDEGGEEAEVRGVIKAAGGGSSEGWAWQRVGVGWWGAWVSRGAAVGGGG